MGINLGDRGTLLGYDLQRREKESILTLYWQARREMGEGYTVFPYLLAGEEIVAQADSQPQDGDYPTTTWDEGEVVIDEHRLTTGELPPGNMTYGWGSISWRLWSGCRSSMPREKSRREGGLETIQIE